MITRRTALRATSGAITMLMAARATAAEETARRRMTMEIKRNGSEASHKGPADWFTGSVRIDPLFQAPEPAGGCSRHLRARRADGVAHLSARPDIDHYLGIRLGAA